MQTLLGDSVQIESSKQCSNRTIAKELLSGLQYPRASPSPVTTTTITTTTEDATSGHSRCRYGNKTYFGTCEKALPPPTPPACLEFRLAQSESPLKVDVSVELDTGTGRVQCPRQSDVAEADLGWCGACKQPASQVGVVVVVTGEGGAPGY